MKFFLIFVLLLCLSQCHGYFYSEQFSGKRGFESFRKHRNVVSMIDNRVDNVEFSKKLLRTRRQNMGGNPQAFSFNVTEDDILDYGVILYLGEGSKVNCLIM